MPFTAQMSSMTELSQQHTAVRDFIASEELMLQGMVRALIAKERE
jgi:hypothetical protein